MNNLVGISGKINSGKDLVGEILQYLNDDYKGQQTFSQWKFIQVLAPFSEYKIKKFADKLKDIVCLLIGCTRQELENREFKETPLSKEWNYYFAKDLTIGLYSSEEYNKLEKNQKSWFEEKQLTPRLMLQLLGTDCGRKLIHPNIWVNSLFADYKLMDNRTYQDPAAEDTYPKWIITDVRFPNEADAIKEKGGLLIRINRPKAIKLTGNITTDIINNTKNFGIEEHESETALDQYKGFDYVITNDGTIEQLIEKIKEIQCTN